MKNLLSLLLLISILAMGCSGGSGDATPDRSSNGNGQAELTEWELKHGFGPIKEPVELTPELDPDLLAKGTQIFNTKCTACHERHQRFVGPPYGDVLDRRTPEFVMNFILNPGENARRHPIGQEMLAEFLTVMPFQNVSPEDARAILEYFRHINE